MTASAAPVHARPLLDRPPAAAGVLAVLAIALIGAWLQWQPLRSADQLTDAENATGRTAAIDSARAATGSDPYALLPRQLLSTLYAAGGDPVAARRQLQIATERQPRNPAAWLPLAYLELKAGRLAEAIVAGDRVLALDHTPDPTNTQATNIVKRAQVLTIQRAGGG